MALTNINPVQDEGSQKTSPLETAARVLGILTDIGGVAVNASNMGKPATSQGNTYVFQGQDPNAKFSLFGGQK